MKDYKKIFIFSFLVLFESLNIYGQQKLQENSYFYPFQLVNGNFKSCFTLTLSKLPEDAVEEVSSLIYSPLFAYDVLLGLPAGFTAHGGVSSNIVTWHFALGPRWNIVLNRISFSLGIDLAYWFGGLNQFGFKSKARGWFGYPNFTIGYAFNNFTISLKTEMANLLSLKQFADDIETEINRKFLAGISWTLFIEQPLWKDNYLSIGIKTNYSKFYYPAWAVFPTWNRFNFIPEVIVGFIF